MSSIKAIALVTALLSSACNFNDNREPPETGRTEMPPGGRPERRAETRPEPTVDSSTVTETSTATETSPATATGTGTDDGSGTDGSSSSETTTTTDSSTGTATPTGPTFADLKTQVLDPYCLSCHQGANAGEAVDFTTYDSLMGASAVLGDDNSPPSAKLVLPTDWEKSVLWLTITSDRMPYFSDPLPTELKTLVRDWLAAGAKP